MKFAFDNDDVITKFPKYFSAITQALSSCKHEIYIITDSCEMYRSQIEKQLKMDGIEYQHLIITSNKEQYCRNNNIYFIIDDTRDYFTKSDVAPMFVCAIR